ncbi:MAG TPA: formate/nitrite transporter family protein [Candidatus Elarobacter sp.]|jgi:formate/nitrite transporter|nr:formate/nitrite transporter family protein [Candidatus Elarobacter sp.]
MDQMKPGELISALVESATQKTALRPIDLIIRGALAGALLAVSSAFATYAAVQTGMPIVGALIFPVGLAMIVLLGLDLVTGAFGIIPLGIHARRVSGGQMLANWGWIFLGNLAGSVAFGALLALALTMSFHAEDKTGLAQKIVLVATAKTAGYEHAGSAGMLTVFIKGMLCNWLVCLGVILGASSRSTFGKIAACWLPITVFYALGFEHAVVNMYAIPTGMLLGAKVSFAQWWIWNQIPVTLGNLVGGYLFTGAALYLTYGQRGKAAATATVQEPTLVPASSPA